MRMKRRNRAFVLLHNLRSSHCRYMKSGQSPIWSGWRRSSVQCLYRGRLRGIWRPQARFPWLLGWTLPCVWFTMRQIDLPYFIFQFPPLESNLYPYALFLIKQPSRSRTASICLNTQCKDIVYALIPLGCCCVMQWMLPPPKMTSLVGTITISRSGKTSWKTFFAMASSFTPKHGEMIAPFAK